METRKHLTATALLLVALAFGNGAQALQAPATLVQHPTTTEATA